MTRSEFMDSLHRALAGNLTSSTVNENMRYYEEYFDTQLRSGRSEEEIIAALGDPRLLAKTILQASRSQTRSYSGQEYDEVYEDGSQGNGWNGERDSNAPWVADVCSGYLAGTCGGQHYRFGSVHVSSYYYTIYLRGAYCADAQKKKLESGG